jgi:hypothetical protein
MIDNLSSLTRDLEHAIQVIMALKICAHELDVEPPASVFEAADEALENLSNWRVSIRTQNLH